jgi:capsular polysaccharide biosynthesis protein
MEEQNKETEIRLQDLWTILKRCWWLVLIAMVIVTVVVYIGLTATHDDEYTATISIYVLSNTSSPESDESTPGAGVDYDDIRLASYLINDCYVLLKSYDNVLAPVMVSQNLEGLISIEQLEKMIKIENKDDTRVLYLSVTSSSAQRSADIANAIGEQACDYFNTLYKQDILNVVDHAEPETKPSNPVSKLMVVLIGLVAGVLVYGAYFLSFILDDKINTADDVEKYLGLSMLGVIPNRQDASRRKSKYGYYYAHDANSDSAKQ